VPIITARKAAAPMRSAEDFNSFYASPDPWGIASSRFRSRAYERCLAPYIDGRSVLELGCGEGHLTRTVLARAESVLAVDISEIALERGRRPMQSFEPPTSWTSRSRALMSLQQSNVSTI
jgi:SAM-dependent methyltransferase